MIKVTKDNTIIFVPRYNTKKADATGAFHPEANAFCKFYGIPQNHIHYMENKLGRHDLAKGLVDTLYNESDRCIMTDGSCLENVVMFCHGYTHGIQFGIRSPMHRACSVLDKEYFDRFISALTYYKDKTKGPNLILYACSTGDDPDGAEDTAPGSGDGSFADTTRDAMVDKGYVNCRVFSHVTAGHTTANPFIKIFHGKGSSEGADMIVTPFSKQFKKLQKLLKTDFRFTLPFMSNDEITEALK